MGAHQSAGTGCGFFFSVTLPECHSDTCAARRKQKIWDQDSDIIY